MSFISNLLRLNKKDDKKGKFGKECTKYSTENFTKWRQKKNYLRLAYLQMFTNETIKHNSMAE